MGEIAPLDDVRSTREYRMEVAGNLLEEFLGQMQEQRARGRSASMGFAEWDGAEKDVAEEHLLGCCGSREWARRLVDRRPYGAAGWNRLMVDAEKIWFDLPETDCLKALACHPRIGEKKGRGTAEFLSLSEGEQAAAQDTLGEVAERLAAGNKAYEERFGFPYIVYASGRTAPDLLEDLRGRMGRDRDTELQEAVRQQWEITRMRMTKWLHGDEEAR